MIGSINNNWKVIWRLKINKSFFYNQKIKRLSKFSEKEQGDLVFDLVNAFALVKNPIDSTLLLQDLLTPSEIRNLSKRLRIAKLLIEDKTDRKIIELMHCSFATIAKVKLWLNQSGIGLRKVIRNLPKRRETFKFKKGYFGYGLPQILVGTYLNTLEAKERERIEKLLENLDDKQLLLKKIQEAVDEEFKDMAHEKKKRNFLAERIKRKDQA